MSDRVHITLHPLETVLEVKRGSPLRDVLFPYGVEFPCGGRGKCKGCRVRVINGTLPVTDDQRRILSEEALQAGWRLACRCNADEDLTLDIAQWEASVLTDETAFSFTPRDGYGVAVDVGTTTLVAQLLDLRTATVLAVRTALNPQARYGADVMTRISAAVLEGMHGRLVDLLRRQIGKMIRGLLDAAHLTQGAAVTEITLVGNTVMHHFFGGLDMLPLAQYPFESPTLGMQVFQASEVGWSLPGNPRVRFLPCLGGFVGSDILAGIIATGLHHYGKPAGLVDLGTNGEIVITDGKRLLCTSTAAGPAFEGARISSGMRASTGAIAEVTLSDGTLVCEVIGNVHPRGVCGSGLVDAVAALLDLGRLDTAGTIVGNGEALELCAPVQLTQTDVRELQLAKGAIAAGIRILMDEIQLPADGFQKFFLAGAFGNYVNTTSARRIGLLRVPGDIVEPSGNTALRGAKMALFMDEEAINTVSRSVTHINLSGGERFEDAFIEEMGFPEGTAV